MGLEDDRSDRLVPTRVLGLEGIVAVDGGYEHTVALSEDGSLFSWGDNDFGELDLRDMEQRNVPTRVSTLSHVVDVFDGYNHCLAVTSDGSVHSWGERRVGKARAR